MADNPSAEIEDPAATAPDLSAQAGGATICPGPVAFPMASGSDADRWTQEFGYPLESQTGGLSIGSLMDELQTSDEAGRFMLEVYDEIVAQKGGEGSEEAAAFLSNFMPPMPNSGDRREHYFKLVFADELVNWTIPTGLAPAATNTAYRKGSPTEVSVPLLNLLGSEILIFASPRKKEGSMAGFVKWSKTEIQTAPQVARQVIAEVEITNQMKPWLGWLIFGASVLLIFAGVGVTIGAVRVAATTGARLLASTALVFEVSDATEYVTGFIGGKGADYNPLREAFKNVGASASGASGAQTAEYIYNTLNIAVGFGGKIGLFAGSLYATTQMPTACQPVEGNLDEQPLPSQGAAQRTVF